MDKTNDVRGEVFPSDELIEVADNTQRGAPGERSADAIALYNQSVYSFCSKMKPRLAESEANTATDYYELGAGVARLQQEAEYAQYLFSTLETELNKDEKTLRRIANVTKVIGRQEFDALIATKNATEGIFTWSHFVALSHVKDFADRTKFVERWEKKSLSAAGLKAIIDAAKTAADATLATATPAPAESDKDPLKHLRTWQANAHKNNAMPLRSVKDLDWTALTDEQRKYAVGCEAKMRADAKTLVAAADKLAKLATSGRRAVIAAKAASRAPKTLLEPVDEDQPEALTLNETWASHDERLEVGWPTPSVSER